MDGEIGYTLNEYQRDARRTQNPALRLFETREHALHGLTAEVGEINSLYQKRLQGHTFDEGALKLEIGDVLWMASELCDCYGWTLEEVAQANIAKLRVRYPERFTPMQSINRVEYQQKKQKRPTPGARHYAKGEGKRG